jgi:multicomponent Na+:H+ antiporter subunit A
MPITFTVSIIGAFSMAGLPPFNGFLSKEMFFTGMVQVLEMDIFNLQTWGFLFPVLAWVGSVFTFIYSMIVVFKPFTGKHHPEKLDKTPHEAPLGMLISPVILASLVIVFGFFPNILTNTMIKPAVSAITQLEIDKSGIYFWHGFTIELFMTLGVILFGVLLYTLLPKWKGIYSKFPEKLSLNSFYDKGLVNGERGAFKLTSSYMTGFIRTYLVYIFTFLIGILTVTMIVKDAFVVDTSDLAAIGVYEVLIALVMVVSAVTILFAKSRLTSIIALGAVGYSVALFFVLFRAPDLALTQLVIETVSVALFLLCFYHLPTLSRHEERMRFKLGNALVAIGVGVVVTLITIASYSSKLTSSISEYYIENVYEEAGGKNMVNVILVDFRGFDTLFEICVLAIAALGIFSMIKLRMTRRKEG